MIILTMSLRDYYHQSMTVVVKFMKSFKKSKNDFFLLWSDNWINACFTKMDPCGDET